MQQGDHRHYRDCEEPYAFTTVENLIDDVRRDIENERGKSGWKRTTSTSEWKTPIAATSASPEAWHRASPQEEGQGEVHLNVEDFAMLAAVLTPKRLDILKTLRRSGPMNVKALSRVVARDYKNVHVDSAALEDAGLIQRNDQGLLTVPVSLEQLVVQVRLGRSVRSVRGPGSSP